MSNPYYQQENSYELNSYGNNPYQSNAQTQPLGGQPYGGSSYGNSASAGGDDDVAFYSEIKNINEALEHYTVLLNNIQNTQRRLLNTVDANEEYNLTRDVDNLTAQAKSQQGSIKQKIQAVLNSSVGDSSKTAQAESTRANFLDQINRFKNIENDYKQQSREQAISQYQIVDPNMSRQEAAQAIDDVGAQQIFSQAIASSTINGQAQSALNEVRTRHREIQKIEQSMRELQQLFSDVEELVAQQDVQINKVHDNIDQAGANIQQGLQHEEEALIKARKARRKKCWCIWICIILAIIIIAAIVGGIAGKFANK